MMALRPGMYVVTEEQFKPYREAYEKQIPKKPTYFRKVGKCSGGQDLYAEESYPMCPICGKQLDYGCRCSNNDCGQKIDWGEVE